MDDDAQAADLVAWLLDQGFSTARHGVGDGRPGNRSTSLVHGPCQVTVSRDRGQWFVEAGPRDTAGFDMGLWEAYLRNAMPSLEPTTFGDETRLLRALVYEIERSLLFDADAPERLGALRDWLQETRWSSAI